MKVWPIGKIAVLDGVLRYNGVLRYIAVYGVALSQSLSVSQPKVYCYSKQSMVQNRVLTYSGPKLSSIRPTSNDLNVSIEVYRVTENTFIERLAFASGFPHVKFDFDWKNECQKQQIKDNLY